MLPGGPLASTIRRRYSGATTGGTGPILATLVPPADDPLAGPSLKSQTLPPDSTANPHRPATACACASVGEFSIRQKSGPSGNCNTFFSVSTLVTRDPGGKAGCATTADDNRNATDIRTATALTRCRFTATPPRWDSPDHLRSSNIGASEHPDSTRRILVCSRPRPGPLPVEPGRCHIHRRRHRTASWNRGRSGRLPTSTTRREAGRIGDGRFGHHTVGAATYQEFEAYWPNQTSDVQFADYLNSTPKLVVSRTLKTVEWQNSRLIKGDVVQELNGPNRRGRRKAPLRKRRRSRGSEARGCAGLQLRGRRC